METRLKLVSPRRRGYNKKSDFITGPLLRFDFHGPFSFRESLNERGYGLFLYLIGSSSRLKRFLNFYCFGRKQRSELFVGVIRLLLSN